MIEVLNLTKTYGNKNALDNVSFKVQKGEIVGLLGPNGAGKSTTMNIVTGYISSTDGDVLIDGIDISKNPDEAKKKIGYLPELPPLYLEMTVKGYLEFVFDLKKVKLNRKEHIDEICRLVKIDDVANRIIKNLSKGYKQRVGLAGALIGTPDVLILDEPTVGLDPKQIIEIRNLIKDLSEKHTIILSSHILSEVAAVCDRVVVISHGKKVADDTPENLASHMAGKNKFNYVIEGDEDKVCSVIAAVDGVMSVEKLGKKENGSFEYSVEFADEKDARRDIFKALAKEDCPIILLYSNDVSLEDVFLQLTQENGVNNETQNETEISGGNKNESNI